MHFLYKVIALSVVFGLGLAVPNPKSRSDVRLFDNDSTEIMDVAETSYNSNVHKSRTIDVALPIPEGLDLIPIVIKLLPKIFALKVKLFPIIVGVTKVLVPKVIFLAIGAIATFAFCKVTNLCSVAYDPAVYEYIPRQVRSLVTPQALEDAQQYFVNALQRYADEEI